VCLCALWRVLIFVCTIETWHTKNWRGKIGGCGGIRIRQPLPSHLSVNVSFKIWRAWMSWSTILCKKWFSLFHPLVDGRLKSLSTQHVTLTLGTTNHIMLYTAEWLCLCVLLVLFLEACKERVTNYYFRLAELLGKSLCIIAYLYFLMSDTSTWNIQ
jgi:hypothetical protein